MVNTQKYINEKYDLDGDLPLVVPGMGRRKLYELFAELGFKIGAEVGVQRGRNADILFKTIPGLKMFLVDPWKNHPNGSAKWPTDFLDKVRRQTHKRLKDRDAVYLEMFSEDAVKHVPDGSLDFVYIDGDHSFDFCMLDIILWSRKIRKGGIISGHDYFYQSQRRSQAAKVTGAVDAFTKCNDISPWYITDRKREDREKGDAYPSWFWVK